jgi:hypothetical protein
MPRRIFGPKSYNLHSSPNIIRMVKSRRMKWAGHVARMGEVRMLTEFLLESLKGRDHLEDVA